MTREHPLAHRARRVLAAHAAVAALLLAACGGDDDTDAPAADVTDAPGDTSADTSADGDPAEETAAPTAPPVVTPPPATGDAKVGGDVRYTFRDAASCFDPHQVYLHPELSILRQITDSLLDQDPTTGEIVPWLAESFEVNDDATEYRLTIRDGVTFSDGTELTPEVVKANFDAMVAMGSKAFMGPAYFAGYIGTEIEADGTVVTTFDAPSAPFLQAMASVNLGMVSLENTTMTPEDRCLGVTGTGPFVLDEVVEKQSAKLVKRTGYDWASSVVGHTGEAYLDSITFSYAGETSVRIGMMQSDQMDGTSNINAVDEPLVEAQGWSMLARPNPGLVNYMTFNMENPKFQDREVRLGLVKSVNQTEIWETLGSPIRTPATSILSNTTTAYKDESALIGYDTDAAATHFEAAGYTMGDSGLWEKDGEPLTVTIIFGQSDETQLVLELVQQQMLEAGVDLQLNGLVSADWNAAQAAGTFEATWSNLTRNDPDVLRTRFLGGLSTNYPRLADPALDELLLAQAATTDAAERADLVAQAQDILVGEGYIIPIDQQFQAHAVSPRLQGLTFESSSRLRFYDAWLDA